jgi:hypothetical protein
LEPSIFGKDRLFIRDYSNSGRPQLLVALFAIAGAQAKAEEEGHEEAKELARAMRALEEGIDNIVRALEKPG